MVYTHPTGHPCCESLVPGLRDADIEYGTNTTRAIAKFVFSGCSRRYPDMRVIWSHAGGTMPFLIRRFDKRVKESPEFQPILPEGFSPEARKFYYDIAQAPERAPMAALRAVAPVSQMLFGTDWPHLTTEEHVTGLQNCGVFDAAELKAIDRDNALAAAYADDWRSPASMLERAFRASWISCQIRDGVSGSTRGSTPSDDSAAATAFDTAPPTGMMPPSPAPLAPSGLFGDGCASSEMRAHARIVGRQRHQVVGERGDQQLALLVVGDLLGERAAEPLHRRADHLAVQRLRIDDAADVVDHHDSRAPRRCRCADRPRHARSRCRRCRSPSNCRTCRRPRARRAPPASRGGRPARSRRLRAT